MILIIRKIISGIQDIIPIIAPLFLIVKTEINEVMALLKTTIRIENIRLISRLKSSFRVISLKIRLNNKTEIKDVISDFKTNFIRSLFVDEDEYFFIKELPRYQ
jgi:hypothetical protein